MFFHFFVVVIESYICSDLTFLISIVICFLNELLCSLVFIKISYVVSKFISIWKIRAKYGSTWNYKHELANKKNLSAMICSLLAFQIYNHFLKRFYDSSEPIQQYLVEDTLVVLWKINKRMIFSIIYPNFYARSIATEPDLIGKKMKSFVDVV